MIKEEMVEMSHIPYVNVVGSLMYAMIWTRPNFSYAVSVESRYMHNPNKDHWKVIKWILRYVKGSLDECLVFNKSKTATYNIIGFVDSNCSGDLVHRHSISSYNFTLCVGAISSKAFL